MRGNKEKRGKYRTAQTGSEPLTDLDLLNEINGGLGYMLNTAKEYNGR